MLTIVIPTYWTREKSLPASPGDAAFDHPTPIDGEDTISRTLESLKSVRNDFNVVVITATVSHEIDSKVEQRLEEIISPFTDFFPVIQFAQKDLHYLRQRMSELNMDPQDIDLEGYSSIRNCQLLIPSILGADTIAAIDDDELVEADFAEKACEFVGKKINGEFIYGVGGRYFYEWGNFRVKEPVTARLSKNVFERKHALQNDSYALFDSRSGRIVETSIVLGGNMVFSRALFEKVPFDPMVTRGEDIDYLINSRIMGFNWKLDKELKIYHYPPPCNPSHKLQEDIIRFIYEKKKIELASSMKGFHSVAVESLKPYPGEFFTESLEDDALNALKQRTDLTGKEAYFLSPEETLIAARERASSASDYFSFTKRWQDIINTLSKDESSKKYLNNKFSQTI